MTRKLDARLASLEAARGDRRGGWTLAGWLAARNWPEAERDARARADMTAAGLAPAAVDTWLARVARRREAAREAEALAEVL